MEEEADLCAAFCCLNAQRIVLIFRTELLGAEAAFAKDVRGAAHIRRLHPGFERDGFIEAEAQFLAVFDGESGFFAIAREALRGIVLGEGWESRCTRPGLFRHIKAPLHDRCGQRFVRSVVTTAVILSGGEGGEQEKGRDEARHAAINAGLPQLSAFRAPHFREGEKCLKSFEKCITCYHMSYASSRTSMSLDESTLNVLDLLAQKWGVSKSEVMRRAVRHMKEEEDMKDQCPKPLKALDWLQNGGGLTVQEAEVFRDEVQAERDGKRYWWEA